jgi:predicted 2-oxoglutarate/Fe(II)-dependent dioxygenase YbiX
MPRDALTHASDYAAAALIFEGALSPAECCQVRELTSALPPLDFDYYPKPAEPVRHAATKQLPFDGCAWLAERLRHYARVVNDCYGFDLDEVIREPLVVTYPEGGFLGWHTDLGAGFVSTRKISLSIQLSEPHEYEGGGLQMVCCEEPLAIPAIGTLAAFPSHLAHRVTPVTRGARWALVTWVHGPSFR